MLHPVDQPCAVEGCEEKISPLAFGRTTLCGPHQVALREIKEKYPDFEELPQEDQKFIIRHLDGCNGIELAKHLKRSLTTIYLHLQKGGIKARKINRSWNIPALEIVRLIRIERFFITIRQAIKYIKDNAEDNNVSIDRGTLAKYVKMGWLGETAYNLGRDLMIRRILLPRLIDIHSLLKEQSRQTFHKPRYYLDDSEVTIPELKEITKISNFPWYSWIKKGLLKARKVKWFYAIKREDLRNFIEQVRSNDEIKIRRKTRQKLLSLDISTINFPKAPFATE